MNVRRLACLSVLLILVGTAKTVLASTDARDVGGMYATLSIRVDGGESQNSAVPWLQLFSDNKYQWGRDSGTFSYKKGGALSFDGLYASWGQGRMDAEGNITFDFVKDGKHCAVKMFRVATALALKHPTELAVK